MGDGDWIRRKTTPISSNLSSRTEHHVTDSVSTGWTDEKHCTFLNSLEASFVDQLYTNQYLSKDSPCWLSRWKKRTPSSDQCKIIHGECLESHKIVSETAKSHKDMKIDSVPLGSNPWIQRLRPIPTSNNENSKSSNIIDDSVFASLLQLGQSRKYSEAVDKLRSVSQIHTQDSADDIREMSGQNFVSDELDTGESKICKKRRLGRKSPDVEPIKDQVVPSKNAFLAPNFNVEPSYPHTEHAESSHRTSQQTNSSLDNGD